MSAPVPPDLDSSLLEDIGWPEAPAARHIAALYREQARESVEAIAAALAAGEAGRAHRLAHGLAGSSATVGAAAMAARCRELAHGGGADLPAPADIRDELTRILARTEAAMLGRENPGATP